jgi:hypothetical protein
MTEWGVRLIHKHSGPSPSVRPMPSREFAEHWLNMRTRFGELVNPGYELVTREVTPWEPVS